jgi:hypothetical protein
MIGLQAGTADEHVCELLILGCETECRVAASGWPLVFVRD